MSTVKPILAAAPVATPRVEAPVEVPEPIQIPLPKKAAAAAAGPVEAPRTSGRPERRRREMSPAVAAVAQAAAAIVNNNKEAQQAFATASVNESAAETVATEGRRKNWDSILKKTASRQQAGGSVIPFESIREAVPAGFHDASILQRAVESGRTLSGLVVSIGTNGLSAQGAGEVAGYLQSLLAGQDFACQSGTDEYVLICSGEQGAGAQRRLSVIAEKLWDFQLRSIGGLGVQFSWGSFEARGERVGEAVATAIEQMQDTRQSRLGNMAKAV